MLRSWPDLVGAPQPTGITGARVMAASGPHPNVLSARGRRTPGSWNRALRKHHDDIAAPHGSRCSIECAFVTCAPVDPDSTTRLQERPITGMSKTSFLPR